MTTISDRIERELGIPRLASLLGERLDAADLQSLLLDVYRRLAARRQPSDVLADYAANRFVRPSTIDPARLLEWERLALSLLPAGFNAVELSPVCPLGTTSVLGGLAQDRALSTIRNTEVVSDSTNVLALEAASRRRALRLRDPRSSEPIHLAASHRLLRTQRYANPKLSSHFRIFSLCSAGRDRGGFQFEMDTLALHIEFYVAAIRAFVGEAAPLRVSLTLLESAEPLAAAVEGLVARLRRALPNVEVVMDPGRSVGRGYYRTVCFAIHTDQGRKPVDLVDGGCVDWSQRLLADVKERLLTSGVGTERVCAMLVG